MRWRDSGLALLALVAAALTALTFRVGTVADVPPPATGGRPPAPVVATADDVADDAAATSPDGPGEAGATATGPAPSAAPGPGLAAARDVLAGPDPVVVAALGDATGNETWEWVYGWARLLGQTRPVTVTSWNEWTEDGYIEPRLVSDTGGGSPVRIWSGHHTGASAAYAAEHVADLLPEPPDLVLLNYGHDNTVADVRAQLEDAVEAVRSVAGPDVPVVLTLQQPEAGDRDADVREQVRALAAEQGLGVIDVAAAFAAAGDPEDLLADDVHPNEEGAAVWAQAVAEALRAP